jgi:hypothetical protein
MVKYLVGVCAARHLILLTTLADRGRRPTGVPSLIYRASVDGARTRN